MITISGLLHIPDIPFPRFCWYLMLWITVLFKYEFCCFIQYVIMFCWNVILSKAAAKLNKLQRMLLVVLCTILRSTTFTVLFVKYSQAQTQCLHFTNNSWPFNKWIQIPFSGCMWLHAFVCCCCQTGKEWGNQCCLTNNPHLPGLQTGMTRPLSTTESPIFRLQDMSPSHSRPRCSCWTINSLLSTEFVSKSDLPATSFMLNPRKRSLERFIYWKHKYPVLVFSI